MKTVADEYRDKLDIGKERAGTQFARLRKYTYTLPSGRTLKVVEFDERELASSSS